MRKLLRSLQLAICIFCLCGSQATAQCAYYVTDSDPWGETTNNTAMDLVFGPGNWTQATFSSNAAAIFAPGNCYVMLEGADANAVALQTFLTSNQVLVENWVAAGGRLFINSAPNVGSDMNWYFGGVQLNTSGGGSPGTAVNPLHPIFLGPNLPTVQTWTGGGFTHGQVTGTGLTDVIYVAGTEKAFCYKPWGNGVVFFGSMTQPNFWDPNPQCTNIWYNIFSYTANYNLVTPAGGLHFDGANDYVELNAQVTSLEVDFTLEAWVKTTGTDDPIVGLDDGDAVWEPGEKRFYIDATGKPAFEAFNAGYIFGTQTVNDGNWHHIAVTFKSSPIARHIYVDGVDVTTTDGSSWFTGGWFMNGTFKIGKSMLGGNFSGSMDEVRMWNRELCQGEIQANMSCELPAGQTGLRGYYKFNQGNVGEANPGENTLTDASGNNFTGVLTNFALTGTTSNWVAGNVSGACTTFNGPATPTPSSNTPVCAGNTINLSTPAVVGATYSWTGPNSFSSAVQNPSITNATVAMAGTYSVTVTVGGCTSAAGSTTVVVNPAVTVSPVSQTNIACFGGSNGAAAVTAGGTGTLSYNWTPGNPTGDGTNSVTGLTAGTWTVTVTDANSCTATQTFIVTQPPAITVSPVSQTNVSCFGGSNGAAAVTASGGTGTLSYNWTPGNPTGDGTNSVTGLTAGTWTVTVTDANGCTATQAFTVTQPPAITISPVSQTNVACFGGSNGAAAVTAAGGTGTLSYNWTPGNPAGDGTNSVTGLTAGTWTVTVTDANSCTATQTFSITQPPAITVSPVSQTNVSCFGGSNGAAAVTAAGGTGTLSYNWTPGNPTGDGTNSVTGLTAGTWTVTVTDANGCTASQTITITQPATLVTTVASQTNVLCAGSNTGSATVGVSGGTLPYTYNWLNIGLTTPTISNLLAGTYAVVVTDANNCTAIQVFNITEPAPLDLSGTQTNVACNGGSNGTATVTPSGGSAPYTFSWSSGGSTTATATGLSAGTYTVTVSDANGCSATYPFNIIQSPTLAITTVMQGNVSCNGGNDGSASVDVTGGTFPYAYSWSPTGITTSFANNLVAGTYTVNVTDANLCSGTQIITITEPAMLTETVSQTDVNCNAGTDGSATVAVTGGTAPYTYSWSPVGGNAATASGLSAGTYVVTITDDNNCSMTKTAIISEPSMLVATSAGQTNVGCNGNNDGIATISATGGTAPYTYLWSDGQITATATNLAAGTYTATVTDAHQCTATQSFTITEPGMLTYASAQTNVSCNGSNDASATITMTGGTAPYTYSWSPLGGTDATANGLSAGTYTVTATDANSCTATATYTITEPTVLAVTTAANSPVCTGSSIELTSNVTGGTAPYTTTWNGPAGYNSNQGSPTIANAVVANDGTYTVTITDANNCSVSATQSVTVDQTPQVTVQPQATTACVGSSAGFSVTAIGTGITYQWRANGNNISDNNIYSGTNSNTLNISNATGLGNTMYDVIVTGVCGNATSGSVMLSTATSNSWTGAVSTAWSDAANWSCGNIPTIDLDVTIPSSAPNMPLVDIPTAAARSLTIDAGSSLGFSGTANKLEVVANITNQGIFDAANGAVKLSGMAAQSIPGGTYRELEIAGADVKVLQADATIMQSLKLTAGYLRLGNRNLTLGASSVITGGNDASFVITDSMGAVTRVGLGAGANGQAEVFPVGREVGIYTPATITNAGDMDNFTVRVIDGVYASYNNDEPVGVAHTENAVNKTWIITEAVDGGSNATVALSWTSGDELPNFSNANCNVSRFDETAGSWVDGPFSAAGSNAGMYTQSVSGISTFSPFAVGTADVPLVVEDIKAYTYGLVLYPNPVSADRVFVKLSNDALATDMEIVVMDVVGKVVSRQNYKAGSYNRQAIEVNIGDIAAGVYTLKLKQDGATSQSAKFSRN